MTNRERTGRRDLTISAWHRQLPDSYSAFDLDLVGMCGECCAHLYVIEATRSSDKSTNWTSLTAQRLNVPGLLVWYSTKRELDVTESTSMSSADIAANIAQIRARRIYPNGAAAVADRPTLEAYLTELRAAHMRIWHGR